EKHDSILYHQAKNESELTMVTSSKRQGASHTGCLGFANTRSASRHAMVRTATRRQSLNKTRAGVVFR
ncbi:hypothetical protein BaRGS_00010678, partial [Batillaria attramentaria]